MIHPKVSIIILNWNGKADTLACLESLSQLSYPRFEVIVIDNGSSDDSVQKIAQQFPQHRLIATGRNLGFAGGNNVGLKAALEDGADFMLLLNNDTVVAPDLVERLLETYAPGVGIVGAKIFLFDTPDTLDHLGGMWDQKRGRFTLVGLREKDRYQEPEPLDYVCGAALMVKREVVEAVGLLEERFFLIWEESDFCFRARRKGFTTLTSPRAHIWHKVSASFVGGKPHSTYFWWRNRLLWIERNCPHRARLWMLILSEVWHLVKIHALKTTQLFFTQWFQSQEVVKKKRLYLRKNRAALCGVRDYLRRKFHEGPVWIYKKLP